MDEEFLNQIDRVDELVSSTEKLDDDVLICECFCVNVGDIKEVCLSLKTFDLKLQSRAWPSGMLKTN